MEAAEIPLHETSGELIQAEAGYCPSEAHHGRPITYDRIDGIKLKCTNLFKERHMIRSSRLFCCHIRVAQFSTYSQRNLLSPRLACVAPRSLHIKKLIALSGRVFIAPRSGCKQSISTPEFFQYRLIDGAAPGCRTWRSANMQEKS